MKTLIACVIILGSIISQEAHPMSNCSEAMVRTQATQEIEYLRRWYGKATDLIGRASEESILEGRNIYHRVFTKDVTFEVSGPGAEPIEAKGPDAWVDVVLDALGELGPTQHLIGTQLVTIDTLKFDGDCNVTSGKASMESYLQAWHEQPEMKVWVFLGTYFDEVIYTPDVGWQIEHMNLLRVGGETRYMDKAVAPVL